MGADLKYTSTAQGFFDSWRIGVLLFAIVVLFAIGVDPEEFSTVVFWGFIGCLLIILMIMLLRVSVISRSGNQIMCSSLWDQAQVSNINRIETWWSYEFRAGGPELSGDGPTGKSQQMINYIYIFAEIKGSDGTVLLYELIQLSEKFPNNHNYRPQFNVDGYRSFKVYDLDDCLEKLNLTKFEGFVPKQ